MPEAADPEAEVNRLLALARQRCSDEWIDSHDEINEDGDKVAIVPDEGPAGTTREREVNLSAMYGSAPSRTSQVDILRIEAELVADGREPDNPHIPTSGEVLEDAREQIEADGNTPAWEVVFDA
jgi:hypothetical protein